MATQFAYVAGTGPQVAVVNLSTIALTTTVTTGLTVTAPNAILMKPDNSEVWVCSSSTNVINVISVATNTVTQTFSVTGATAISNGGFLPDGSAFYVSARSGGTSVIYPINTSTYTSGTALSFPAASIAGSLTIDPSSTSHIGLAWTDINGNYFYTLMTVPSGTLGTNTAASGLSIPNISTGCFQRTGQFAYYGGNSGPPHQIWNSVANTVSTTDTTRQGYACSCSIDSARVYTSGNAGTLTYINTWRMERDGLHR